MKIIALLSFLVSSSILFASTSSSHYVENNVPLVVSSTVQKEISVTPDVDIIASFVKRKALQYGVDFAVAMTIIQNESHMVLHPKDGDTNLICNASTSPNLGKVQRSRGIWQINDCWHYEVTDAQAYDLEWSTDWAMKQLRDGKCYEWSTCPLGRS